MVQVQKAPASHADLVSLKEQAKNHVVGETQLVTEPASQREPFALAGRSLYTFLTRGKIYLPLYTATGVAALAEDGLNGTHSFVNGSAPTMQQRENGASASAAVGAAFAGGSEASDGLVASQNGLTYSQTGDLVGPGPDQGG